MPTIIALAKPDGSIAMTPYQDATKRQFAKDNPGRIRIILEKVTPESKKQRAFYHGAIIPLIAFFQEGMEFRRSEDIEKIHEWLKLELNGAFVEIKGKAVKVGMSTTGGKLNAFIERVIDWMTDNYGSDILDALNTERYKNWNDKVFPYGGPDNYIDYLLQINVISIPNEKKDM